MPVVVQDIALELANSRAAAQAFGPADAPVVLALHGWLDNSASFAPLAAALPEYRLIALDFPGHGRSDALAAGPAYHFVDYVSFVSEALDALKLERVMLLGHSMGGGVASLFAGVFPERIAKLVLIEGLGPISAESDTGPERLRKAIEERQLKKTEPVYSSIELATTVRARVGRLPLDCARLLVERNLRPVEGGFVWRTDPRLKLSSPLRMTEAQVRAFLERISAPSLFLYGRDTEFGEYGKMLFDRTRVTPGMRTAELPGGHHMHMEYPEATAAVIREFLGA